MTSVESRRVEIALEHCSPSEFERFGQSFLAAIFGDKFVPVGGIHDGGVDGFMSPPLVGASGADEFYQISKQEEHRSKIRQTLGRLKATGRVVRELTLLTSRHVAAIDQEESMLSRDVGLTIRIRDRKWISSRVDSNPAAQQAYLSTLEHVVSKFLSGIGTSRIASKIADGVSKTAYVFLAQEVDRRRGDTQLIFAVSDALVLWALDGTDAQLSLFRDRAEVEKRIYEGFPSAKKFLPGLLDKRLEELSSKADGTERQIRWHKKRDQFCLPFHTRQLIERENFEDETLQLAIAESFANRAAALKPSPNNDREVTDAAAVAIETVQLLFKEQGIDLAAFLSESDAPPPPPSVADFVDKALETRGVGGALATTLKERVLGVLRGAFYESNEVERQYFNRLCRTYALLLSLNQEPRIVEYFQSMTTKMRLYVGSDLLVLALSEHLLEPADQMVANCLRVAKTAGARLILAEPVVEEVSGHLGACDGEYQALFADKERFLTKDVVRHAKRLLVRSFLYAKIDGRKNAPKTWKAYVNQFMSFENIGRPDGKTELTRYLCEKFHLDYEDTQSLFVGIDMAQHGALAADLVTTKAGDRAVQRAQNDAALVLAIYAKRNANNESGGGNPFGFVTWWLTKESKIRTITADLVKKKGSRFLMVPEFLLNFIALAPSAADVRRTFENVFPTRLGVKLSNRMRNDVFEDFMKKYSEASTVDPARRAAKLAAMSDELKGDNFKNYERKFGNNI